jgi:hypothetical protein
MPISAALFTPRYILTKEPSVDLTPTRTALHGIAELLMAGPQYAESGTIRLRVAAGGIETVAAPRLRLDGAELVGPGGGSALEGSYAGIAAAVGVTPRALDDVYHDRADVGPDDEVAVDPGVLRTLLDALAAGDQALRAFAPEEAPVLWPEHLDVGIARDEVNYGVSPGDSFLPEPYAYVGPWTARSGEFWNESFGAARPLSELADQGALLAFFVEGAERAATDPAADPAR